MRLYLLFNTGFDFDEVVLPGFFNSLDLLHTVIILFDIISIFVQILDNPILNPLELYLTLTNINHHAVPNIQLTHIPTHFLLQISHTVNKLRKFPPDIIINRHIHR
jgi:hypothetical protein